MQIVMSMLHTDLIVLTDRTALIAAIVPIDQALTEAMHLIPQAATAVMALTAIIIRILPEVIPRADPAIPQAAIRQLR